MTIDCKVLIVDDEHLIRYKIQEILRRNGIPACMAENGLACIEAFRDGFRGVVLMDAAMPELDGWETLEQLVANGYQDKAVVCMLTGQSEPSPKMDAFKEYVIDYIVKPFQVKDLVETVRHYVTFFDDTHPDAVSETE